MYDSDDVLWLKIILLDWQNTTYTLSFSNRGNIVK